LRTLFNRSPEPLSSEALRVLRAALPDDQVADLFYFMETERTGRVLDQLHRYCKGEQDGVSILVAGTRGAGKTTLARLVVQHLIVEGHGLIPLPILIHGPTLLRPEPEPLASAALENLSGYQSPREQDALREREQQLRKVRLKTWVMRGLIAALYRHLCNALVDAWENAVRSRRRRPGYELDQLRAHIDLRLDEAPNVTTLRKLWRRAGFLGSGVAPFLYPIRWARKSPGEWPKDQGVRELVAVAACALSYLTILGKPNETIENVNATRTTRRIGEAGPSPAPAEDKPGARVQKDDTSRDQAKRIGPPVLATIATALGVATNGQRNPLWALLIGSFVYVLSFLSFSMKSQRDQFSELRRNLVVDVDWSERRLERELPALLRRVKHAGFAPIFVLDELDKLEDQTGTLHDFLDLTKHIVRDYAAFLFLTNRDYFEQLLEQGQPAERGDLAVATLR
jgi:hypothetical protein